MTRTFEEGISMDDPFSDWIEPIEEKIGYQFTNKTLLKTAFVHRSYHNENKEKISEHNERLEFLGDAVLGLIVSCYLFDQMPQQEEGVLSHLRSRLVDATSCAQYTQALGLSQYVLLGKGEKMNDGKGRESIIADLFEALLGALFKDGGFSAAETFFLNKCTPTVEILLKDAPRNFKAELQEITQKRFKQTPSYRVLKESGPEHHKNFFVEVFIEESVLGQGEGLSKKQAEQMAAEQALLKLKEEYGQD